MVFGLVYFFDGVLRCVHVVGGAICVVSLGVMVIWFGHRDGDLRPWVTSLLQRLVRHVDRVGRFWVTGVLLTVLGV